jgi:hypothetical protein
MGEGRARRPRLPLVRDLRPQVACGVRCHSVAGAARGASGRGVAVAAGAMAAALVPALWGTPMQESPSADPPPQRQPADLLLRGPSVPPNSSNVLAGSFAWERGGFTDPIGCAATGDGRFIVADSCGLVHAVSAADGTTLWSVDRGAGGQFVRPASVAPYGDGAVLVSDPARRTVAILSTDDGADLGAWPADGELRRVWDGFGLMPGKIASAAGPGDVPRVVVADARAPGRLAVCDGETHRLVPLPFVPSGIAIAADGSIMATDRDGHRVVRIDADALADPASQAQLSSWGGRGPYPGLLNSPRGLCAAGPWILVADEHNHRIARSDVHGAGKLAYGQHAVRPRAGGGKVHYPVDVAYDAQSGHALVCEPFERRIQAYRVNLDPEPAEVRVVLPSLEGVQSHFGAGADADGQRLVMQDPESASVVIFDLSLDAPAHVATLGMGGSKPHEFVRISSIAMSGGGALICIADDGARRLSLWSLGPREDTLRFNPFAGRLLSTRSYESIGLQPSECVADAVATGDGFLLLVGADAAGTDAPRAIMLDHLLDSPVPRALASAGDGRWSPRAIASDEAGERITWIARRADAPAGAPMRYVLVGKGARELDAQDPVDLCVAPDGRALVVDRAGDRVIVVPQEPSAESEAAWGGRGAADGMLWLPAGIVRYGDIAYVIDAGNHRGQAFRLDGTWLSTFGLGRSYTRPRSEAEVLGLPGATRGGSSAAAAPAATPPVPVAARPVPQQVLERLWWTGPHSGDAVTAPVRSGAGGYWIRARIASEAPLPDASTPPLRRPFTLSIEAFADQECTRPYEADAALIDSWMPHHRHGMNVAPRIVAEGPGRWRAEGMMMHMSGLWEIDVDLIRGGRSERAQWMVELP